MRDDTFTKNQNKELDVEKEKILPLLAVLFLSSMTVAQTGLTLYDSSDIIETVKGGPVRAAMW